MFFLGYPAQGLSSPYSFGLSSPCSFWAIQPRGYPAHILLGYPAHNAATSNSNFFAALAFEAAVQPSGVSL